VVLDEIIALEWGNRKIIKHVFHLVLFTWLQEGTQMQSPWAENIPGEW
jgi:hypothetical protein